MRAAAAGVAFAAILAGAGGARAEDAPFWHRGRLDLRYDYRSTGDPDRDDREDDQDLFQDLFVEGGKEGSFRGELSGRVHEGIDGRPAVSVFRDIYDTYDSNVQAYLYTGYVEALDRGPIARAAVGRMYYANGVEVRFDGALVETEPLGGAVALTAWGGIPAYLYETSRTGDWTFGAAAELVSLPRTNIRLDYAHVTDHGDSLQPVAPSETSGARHSQRDDDYFQLAATHRLTPEVRLFGQASTLDFESARFHGEVFYGAPDLELDARVRYVVQIGPYRDLTIAFAPLDQPLDAYEPYQELYADVRKGLFEQHLSLGGGVALRALFEESDEGPFNHEFVRVFALGDVRDWPWPGLELSLVGDYYASQDPSDETFQGSFDLRQAIGPVRAGIGTAYAHFKFDEFFLEERESVRSYFASVEWQALTWLRLRADYSFEDDDEEYYHVARFGVRVGF